MSEMETILSTRRQETRADMRHMRTFFETTMPRNNKENRNKNKPPTAVKKLIQTHKRQSIDSQEQARRLLKNIDEKINHHGQRKESTLQWGNMNTTYATEGKVNDDGMRLNNTSLGKSAYINLKRYTNIQDETDEHCLTFIKKPRQRKRSNYITGQEVDSLVKRLFKYEQERLKKLQYATVLKQEEEMFGITFQPQLVSQQIPTRKLAESDSMELTGEALMSATRFHQRSKSQVFTRLFLDGKKQQNIRDEKTRLYNEKQFEGLF